MDVDVVNPVGHLMFATVLVYALPRHNLRLAVPLFASIRGVCLAFDDSNQPSNPPAMLSNVLVGWPHRFVQTCVAALLCCLAKSWNGMNNTDNGRSAGTSCPWSC